MTWTPAESEVIVTYDRDERVAYEAGRASEFDPWAWPTELRVGRNQKGCFPEVAVRAHFEQRGYRVLVSEPRFPDGYGFILFHYAGMRRDSHPAFRRMEERFPDVDLNAIADQARDAKIRSGLSGGGGDPDLFVFRPDGSEQFFVEVKDEDDLHANQLVCFPIIEEQLKCPVKVARIQTGGGESEQSDS